MGSSIIKLIMETYKSGDSEKDLLSHLKEGASPIVACIGTREDFEKEPGLTRHLTFFGENPKTLLVDYYEDHHNNDAKGITNERVKTYAISGISELNKFSLRYKNCTGIIVSGQDKVTGQNISFFTHQDSMKVLPDGEVRDRFLADIKGRLREMNNRSTPGTIDAVIFGGNYLDSEKEHKKEDPGVGDRVEYEKKLQRFNPPAFRAGFRCARFSADSNCRTQDNGRSRRRNLR